MTQNRQKTDKKTRVYCVQRQSILSTRNTPSTGLAGELAKLPGTEAGGTHPRPGPRNGLRMNKVDGGPRSIGRYVSLSTPAPTARLGPKKKPDKNLMMTSPAKLCVSPEPRANRPPRTTAIKYTECLPAVSERGPPKIGPRPRARTYIDKGRKATVLSTPNSAISWE